MKVYIQNVSWIVVEKIVSAILGMLGTVIVARHLGPSQFGLLAYVLSVTSIFASASHLGMSGIVVKALVSKPEEKAVILGSVLAMKSAGAIVGVLLMILYMSLNTDKFEGLHLVTSFAMIAAFIQILYIYEYWFLSKVQSKYISISKLSANISALFIKVGLVYFGLSVSYFSIPLLAQAIVVVVVLSYLFQTTTQSSISEWAFNFTISKKLFKEGMPVFIGTVLAVVNLKVDQIMIMEISGSEEAGIYAVAVQLSEAWYILPAAITASVFPRLIKLKSIDCIAYGTSFQKLMDCLFLVAVAAAMVVTLVSDQIVELLFGDSYEQSAFILSVHIWAAVFIYMRAACSKWIIIEEQFIFSVYTQGAGAVINVILNLLLIPKYGALGAAYATLISYSISSFFAFSVSAKTRPVFMMMLLAIVSPVRIVRDMLKNV